MKNLVKKNKSLFKFSRDVLNAIEVGKPLVALESSIIAHGMPDPQS